MPYPVEPLEDTAELTRVQRGILGTTGSADYTDQFSRLERRYSPDSWRPKLVEHERQYSSRGQILTLRWKDLGQPLPPWFDYVTQGFADLITLEPNWDSYKAKPIEKAVIRKAMATLDALLVPTSPTPNVVPLSNGGVQIEWHRNDQDLELVFEPGQPPEFYYKNAVTGAEEDGMIFADWRFMIQLIRALE